MVRADLTRRRANFFVDDEFLGIAFYVITEKRTVDGTIYPSADIQVVERPEKPDPRLQTLTITREPFTASFTDLGDESHFDSV